jgi:hypothetical protein
LIRIKAAAGPAAHPDAVWQPITTAPYQGDLELAVIETDEPHALVFPCRRVVGGWINAATNERIEVRPTHWRPWGNGLRPTP